MNKSYKYLFPLFVYDLELTRDHIDLLQDTYLFMPGDSINNRNIYLKYDYSINEDGDYIKQFIKIFKNSNYYLTHWAEVYGVYSSIYIKLEFPELFLYEYELFLKGKYSKYSDFAKNNIIFYLQKYHPNDSYSFNRICKVLSKDVSLRKELEERLHTKISEDSELENVPDINEETIILF